MTGNKTAGRPLLRHPMILALPLLAALLASCGTAAKNDTFDLSLTPATEGPSAKTKQVLVPQPTAVKMLDSDQVVVRVSSSEVQYLADSRWGDTLPNLVQAKLVQAFENSHRLGGVGKPGQGLAIDYQVVTDIRTFEVNASGPRTATVEISAKILNDRNGTVKAQNVFRAVVPVSGADNRNFIGALNKAFAQVGSQIVDWSLKSM
ncbi:MAG: ABC-type transport auxiliary lipoprotein family protein [Neorhizobium sp.]|jgi:cholesterol transport system auxiliary component|nr:ABC-type transport auxiliary lipoprotein family protein [Neorhizobium sp.]